MVNDGHIIIRPDAHTALQRAIEYQTDKTAKESLLAGTAQMQEDGFYDAQDPSRKLRRLTVSQLREVAQSFALRGVAVKVAVTQSEAVVTFKRWKTGMVRSSTFSLAALPFEGGARAALAALAETVRC